MGRLVTKKKLKDVRSAFGPMLVIAGLYGCSPSNNSVTGSPASTDTSAASTSGASSASSANKATVADTFAIQGNLALTQYSLALTATETIVKATYAEADEDKGTLDASGGFNIAIKKGMPFALTVFQDSAPVCSFIFNVGGKNVGSLKPSTDINFGSVSCEDGQASISEDKISSATDNDFKKQVESGAVDETLIGRLLDAKGLSILALSSFSDKGAVSAAKAIKLADSSMDSTVNMPTTEIANSAIAGGAAGSSVGNMGTDPKLCTAAGYSVSNFYYDSYYNSSDAAEASANDGPTLFFVAKEDGSYDMIARSQDDSGNDVDDVFPNINLGGSGEEFAMVGQSNRAPSELKAQAAGGILRDVLAKSRSNYDAPPMPSFTDYSCDPKSLVNQIVTQLGHSAYTGIDSVFPSMPGMSNLDNFSFPTGSSRPLCSNLSGQGNSLSTIKEFCFDSDGNLKDQTLLAAKSICQVANDGGPVNFFNSTLKDENGDSIRICVKSSNNQWGSAFKNEFLDKTEDECNALQADAWANPPTDGSWVDYRYQDATFSMNYDCSILRTAETPVNLKECQWSNDSSVQSDWSPPDWQSAPQPMNWWSGSLTLKEASVAIDDALASQSGSSLMQNVKDTIDRCVGNFDRTVEELNKNKAKVDSILTAVNLIATTKDEKGNLKYIKSKADKFKQSGDFSFGQAEVTKLQGVLAKANASLKSWGASINQIKNTYAILKDAALKAEASDNQKCLPDEIGDKDAFVTLYHNFDLAYNGKTGDSTNRGLKKWQEAAFRHLQCMGMDTNLMTISQFGISAPTTGIKDSNLSSSEDVDGLFLSAADSCDYYDYTGKCVTTVACQVPGGAETYIPFDKLLDKAQIQAGCETVVEKVAMTGRINKKDQTINNIDVAKGDILANVTLMTNMPNKSCKLTLSIPKLDKNSCFTYEDSDGNSWADLSDEDRAAANPKNYSLSYTSQDVKMLSMSKREVMNVVLTPNSEKTTAADEAQNSASDQ